MSFSEERLARLAPHGHPRTQRRLTKTDVAHEHKTFSKNTHDYERKILREEHHNAMLRAGWPKPKWPVEIESGMCEINAREQWF